MTQLFSRHPIFGHIKRSILRRVNGYLQTKVMRTFIYSFHFSISTYHKHGPGYPLSQYTIHPFSDRDLTNDPNEAEKRKTWNVAFSGRRIAVEHAFDRLQGCFPYLCMISGHRLNTIFRNMEALMILHNILAGLDDHPEEMYFEPEVPGGAGDGVGPEEEAEEEVDPELTRLHALGVAH